jgi:hypothetical protein
MKWLRLLFFLIVIYSIHGFTVKGKYDYFTTDNLGNIYLIHEDELIKYLPSGKLFARYSNLKLGSITSVDATNPLKILLYYRNFQQIVFLDNQLSQNSESVSIEKLGYEQADLVCAGSNNSFWIYNKQNSELLRFDQFGRQITSTGNLKQVLNAGLNPDFMIEHNNLLYLNSPASGIFVFDVFGAFSKLVTLRGLHSFQVWDNQLFFQRDTLFCRYDQVLLDDFCESFPRKATQKGIRAFGPTFYLGYRDSVVTGKR